MEFGVSFLVGLLTFVSLSNCFDVVYPPALFPLHPADSSSTGDAHLPPADFPAPSENPTASEENDETSGTFVPPGVVFPPGLFADDPLGQLWELVWNQVHVMKDKVESVEAYRDKMIPKVNQLSYQVFAWCRCKNKCFRTCCIMLTK